MGEYRETVKKIAAAREKQLAEALALNAEMLAALKAVDVLSLIIEHAVRRAEPDCRDKVVAAIMAARAVIAKAEGGRT